MVILKTNAYVGPLFATGPGRGFGNRHITWTLKDVSRVVVQSQPDCIRTKTDDNANRVLQNEFHNDFCISELNQKANMLPVTGVSYTRPSREIVSRVESLAISGYYPEPYTLTSSRPTRSSTANSTLLGMWPPKPAIGAMVAL